MSIYSKVQRNVTSYYAMLQEKYSAKYLKEAMIGVGLLVVLGGGYVLNTWYVNQREEKAFESLLEVVTSFNQAQRMALGLDPVKDQEKINLTWNDTLLLVDALYGEHMGSYLAPYFLAYKSQVILEKDKNLEEAIKILDEALPRMSKNSELGSLFYLKRIKMGFDSADEKVRDQAQKDLVAMADDVSSVCQQEAQYTLALYYAAQGQIAQARELFKKLVDSADETAVLKNPWVKLAQEKLGSAF